VRVTKHHTHTHTLVYLTRFKTAAAVLFGVIERKYVSPWLFPLPPASTQLTKP
jgi:hypothetical protein